MSSSVQLEQQPEQFELPTIMDPESRLEEDEILLSQSENDKSAEMTSTSLYTFWQLSFAYSDFYTGQQSSLLRLGLSFFLFGLINNGAYVRQCAYTQDRSHKAAVLYVIILSAALDLVPPSTPKGIIAFWNIAPSLVAKFSWPYILKGRIRYVRRLVGCCFLSVTGMIVSRILCPSADIT